jgi:hypothetical protein
MFTTDEHESSPFAIIKGGKFDHEFIYIRDTDEAPKSAIKKLPIKFIHLDKDSKFEILPSPDIRVLYVAGPSGAGKSTLSAQYIDKFLALHPKSKFFVFSRLDKDPVIDALKPKRIAITQDLVLNPIELEDINKDSIVLFDDIDNISDKKIQTAVNIVKAQILEMGRHNNINIVCTSHLINGNEKSSARIMLNEMQALVIFPKSGSAHAIKYALKTQFGLSTTQMNQILNIDSRWIMLKKNYPQAILSEKDCLLASEL